MSEPTLTGVRGVHVIKRHTQHCTLLTDWSAPGRLEQREQRNYTLTHMSLPCEIGVRCIQAEIGREREECAGVANGSRRQVPSPGARLTAGGEAQERARGRRSSLRACVYMRVRIEWRSVVFGFYFYSYSSFYYLHSLVTENHNHKLFQSATFSLFFPPFIL